MKPISNYGDIKDDIHKEVVFSAICNMGMEIQVDEEKDTATDMFYKVWQCFTCDSPLSEGESEQAIVDEVNAAIRRLHETDS